MAMTPMIIGFYISPMGMFLFQRMPVHWLRSDRLTFTPLKVQINAHHKTDKTMEANSTTVTYHLEASEFG